jgi:hypothetical protein
MPLVFITIVLPLVLGRIVRWLLNTNLNIIAAIFRDTVTFTLIVVNELKCFEGVCGEFPILFEVFYLGLPAAVVGLKCYISGLELSMVDGVCPHVRVLFQLVRRERMFLLDVTFSTIMWIFYWKWWYYGVFQVFNYLLITLFLLWRVGRIWQMYRDSLEISNCSQLS